MKVKLIKKNPKAIIPQHQTQFSAGLDLHACLDETIGVNPKEWKLIPTGLIVEIPEGYFGGVYPRSGNAFKYGVNLMNCVGVLDADFRGEVGILIFNNGNEAFGISHGDRIAQLIIQPYSRVEFEEVETLEETNRGDGGFGHSGKN